MFLEKFLRWISPWRQSPLALRFLARGQIAAILAGIVFLACPLTAKAQDPFESHVYEYEQLPPGGFTLEGHFNLVGIGTKSFEGTVAPTNHQFHMTGELTGGSRDNVSLGFMLLTAVRPIEKGVGSPGKIRTSNISVNSRTLYH
jgi:hypothetical protein